MPTLQNLHAQAVAPLQLDSAGLPWGEAVQALLATQASPWVPALVWVETLLDVQSLPTEQQELRSPPIVLRRLRAAARDLDAARVLCSDLTSDVPAGSPAEESPALRPDAATKTVPARRDKPLQTPSVHAAEAPNGVAF